MMMMMILFWVVGYTIAEGANGALSVAENIECESSLFQREKHRTVCQNEGDIRWAELW